MGYQQYFSVSLALLFSVAASADVFSKLKESTLEASPEIREVRSLKKQKSSQVWTAATRWLPRLSLQLSQTRSKDYSYLTSGILGSFAASYVPQETDYKAFSLGASMPLYSRSVHLGLSQASLESEISDLRLKVKEAEIEWKLRSLYGNWLLQLYRNVSLLTSEKIAETNVREAKVRFETGQRTRIDILRAESNLLSIQSRKDTLKAEIRSALSALLEYSGLTLDSAQKVGIPKAESTEQELLNAIDDFALLSELDLQLKPIMEQTEEGRAEVLVRQSPVYQSIQLEEELSERRASLILSEHWPDLALRGSLNKSAQEWSTVQDDNYRSYSYGLVLTIPLFSSGSLISQMREQSETENLARIKREKDLRALKNEVENLVDQVAALRKNLASLRLSLDRATEIEKLSFKSYQLGRTTFVELLSSQNELLDAKNNYAKAQIDLAVTGRRLLWNLGELK